MAHPQKSHAQKSRQEVPQGATAKPDVGEDTRGGVDPGEPDADDRAPTQAPHKLPPHPHQRPPR